MGREEQDREGFIPGGQPGGRMPVPTLTKKLGRMRNVAFDIGAIAPGAVQVTNPKVYYNGAVVTQVPAGGNFEIHCDWTAQNTLAVAMITLWSVCVVVFTDDGAIKNYKIYNNAAALEIGTTLADNNAVLDTLGENVMPNNDIVLKFNIFAKDGTVSGGGTPPDFSVWGNVKV